MGRRRRTQSNDYVLEAEFNGTKYILTRRMHPEEQYVRRVLGESQWLLHREGGLHRKVRMDLALALGVIDAEAELIPLERGFAVPVYFLLPFARNGGIPETEEGLRIHYCVVEERPSRKPVRLNTVWTKRRVRVETGRKGELPKPQLKVPIERFLAAGREYF